MEDFLVVEVSVRSRGRKIDAKGLWHIPQTLTKSSMNDLCDKILAAMRGWFAANVEKVGPGAQLGHRYVPVKMEGAMAEAALRECYQFAEDSPERLVDVRIINILVRRPPLG